jgi:imidazole glycerol phosphate synthase glutamine amidotransferase subunit
MSVSSGSSIVVVRTGTANLASVLAALRRAAPECEPIVSDDREMVARADRLVLPGVGAFGAAMEQLQTAHLIETLRERMDDRRPTLCICLGLQLLLQGSDESPGVNGIGVAPGVARRFPPQVRVPQMGFNRVTPVDERSTIVTAGAAYFANSYRLVNPPSGWTCSWTDYAGRFVSAMEREAVLACQFHPELSGSWGEALLRRWLALPARRGGGERC